VPQRLLIHFLARLVSEYEAEQLFDRSGGQSQALQPQRYSMGCLDAAPSNWTNLHGHQISNRVEHTELKTIVASR